MFIHKNCINNIDSGITDYETKSFVDNNKKHRYQGCARRVSGMNIDSQIFVNVSTMNHVIHRQDFKPTVLFE
jgi:hypothetical protein